MLTTLAITAAAALTCTAVGTGLLRTRAQAWGLVDIPNERSMHTRVTPRGGGIVLVFAVLTGLTAAALSNVAPAGWAAYAGVTLLVAAIGWRDDMRSVAPTLRLLTHVVAAATAIAVWGTLDRVLLPFSTELALPGTLAAAATMVWLVGLLNAYNFMDGIDGIASGQAVVAGAMWVLVSGTAAPLATATAALIAAASLGFLVHNWSPARIFMGDAGSGFLGFSFALMPLLAYHATGNPRLPVAGLLIVAPFVFDTMYTLIRRLIRGERIMEAHRTHLYQRMVTSGLSHSFTAALYIGLALSSGAAAVAWAEGASGLILIAPVAAVLSLPLLTAVRERRRPA
jgi:UDP-N-acetylmuramyl pentapeptide phosphotransferase/UDP-N-acetylglucosamine-1-phosphate transferase